MEPNLVFFSTLFFIGQKLRGVEKFQLKLRVIEILSSYMKLLVHIKTIIDTIKKTLERKLLKSRFYSILILFMKWVYLFETSNVHK